MAQPGSQDAAAHQLSVLDLSCRDKAGTTQLAGMRLALEAEHML